MNRDQFAQEVLLQTDRMYRIAYTLLRNDEDCRDAMQEAALRAWEKRHSLREERYFATWLTRILINECRNIQRKRKRLVSIEEIAEPAVQAEDPALAIALQHLPERLRLPLMLHVSEGLSYDEISAVLHLPKTTIAGRIHRAKQQLRKELEV